MIKILDEGRESSVDGTIRASRVVVPAASLQAALGFARKPEGLCRDELCVPVRPGDGLEVDGGYDVTRLAELLGRPVALDEDVAYIGAASDARARALRSLAAPDFSLPDLDGRMHSLSEHRGKKVILVAYASW